MNQFTIMPFDGINPTIHDSVFLCDGVRIVGDVTIGANSSIWFNTVIRGDVNTITIGEDTNIQDLSMLHVTWKKYPLTIGNGVTVGHSAVLHGATIHDYSLIGMGAKVLDRAVVGTESLVAAGTVVREGFEVPPRTLVAGVPGKVIRDLTDEEVQRLHQSAEHYKHYVGEYRK